MLSLFCNARGAFGLSAADSAVTIFIDGTITTPLTVVNSFIVVFSSLSWLSSHYSLTLSSSRNHNTAFSNFPLWGKTRSSDYGASRYFRS